MRIKTAIKTALFSLLGEQRTRSLLRKIKGGKQTFSEADLIYAYFLGRKEPGVMVDVGAHFGESFRPYLLRKWKIYAFEPDSKNRAKLLRQTAANDIRLFPVAVSDHEAEEVSFFASDESDGISSLSAFRPTHHEVERVKMRTLRRILADENVNRIDFLKIDTEGHDLFVLKGFPWDRMTPEVILCEFEDSKTVPLGYDSRVMGDYLLERGYQVFLSEWMPIVRYGTMHIWRSWERYPCRIHDPSAWGNFVAIRRGHGLASIQHYLQQFQENDQQYPPSELPS